VCVTSDMEQFVPRYPACMRPQNELHGLVYF
jgi:hypothetical protein